MNKNLKSGLALAMTSVMATSAITGCGNSEATRQQAAAEATAPQQVQEQEYALRESIYQVGLLQSLTLGDYDGYLTVGELKNHGDTGIGTFEAVNGEMIVVDGIVYQALGDGSVVVADDAVTVPFATVTVFDEDIRLNHVEIADMDGLKKLLNETVVDEGVNQFYMVKGEIHCDSILVRSELKQEEPYRPLNEALATDQREYSYENVDGKLVALYCPSYADHVNTPGWHFHFVSNDGTKGGHMLAITNITGSISFDLTGGFEMHVPDTRRFNSLNLAQNLDQAIKEVEQNTKEK